MFNSKSLSAPSQCLSSNPAAQAHYFSPGPSALPNEVKNRVHNEMLNPFGIGVSILEVSHRSAQYEEVNNWAHETARRVLQVPESHELFFTPFGAQQHFCLLIQHLSLPGDTVAYGDTGHWAHAAVVEAQRSGRTVLLPFDGSPAYTGLGSCDQYKLPSEAQVKYLHLTVNNTVYGTEYKKIPNHLGTDLLLDMTSSLAARTDIPWSQCAVVYASAQKNFGIAGCSVVVVRKDVLANMRETVKKNKLGNALSYPSFFDAKSALNTPPCFAIWVSACYLEWIGSVGGVQEMEKRALAKASLVYDNIDGHFYKGRCLPEFRSRHNFVFSLQTAELDEKFQADAAKEGILEIRGYKSTGGLRCSMYNGVSMNSAKVFAEFMQNFRNKNG